MTRHLLHVFATFVPGGPQVRTASLIEGLGAGWRHSIVAMDGRTEARELLPADGRAAIVAGPPRGGALRTVRALRRLIDEARADLLLTYNWGAIEAVAAARSRRAPPVLHHEEGFRPDEAFAFKRRRIWARRLLLPRAHAVVVPSHTLHAIAIERWRLPSERVRLVPNGVRVDEFARADGRPRLRAELAIPLDAVVAGTVGHLRAEKNPVRLVRSVARVAREHPLHLLVLGDGPERAAVEEAARTAGIAERVHLVGYRKPAHEYYRAMDLFASGSDTEQMPVALLEAMACGLPVAATAVGDVPRILPRDQAPFLAAMDGDPEAELASAIARLVSDAELRERLGRANRERVEREYAFEGMLETYRRVYEEALAADRG